MDASPREKQRWETRPQREMARVGTFFPGSWDTGSAIYSQCPATKFFSFKLT